jgi:hypothetical protein
VIVVSRVFVLQVDDLLGRELLGRPGGVGLFGSDGGHGCDALLFTCGDYWLLDGTG